MSTKRPSKSKKRSAPKGKAGSFKRILISFAVLVFVSLCISFTYFYSRIFSPNLIIEGKSSEYIYIKSSDSFEDVLNQLSNRGMLKNRESFIWLSSFMDYQKKVKPGRYKVKDGMTNRELVSLLRSGKQEPIRITFQNIRTKQAFAGKVGRNLEADSTSMIEILNNPKIMKAYGLDTAKALSLFLPDTYEFYWNTTAPEFVEKLGKTYQEFWNDNRLKQAEKIGLSPGEISIIASIVVQESNMQDEWPVIAGVYLNRLRIGMKLQADPTVKFALNDFDLRRIRSNHLQVESPYNTYKYEGLPPGPIYMAGRKSIDAVLNYQSHSYLYFCARPDRSGYHDFAVTFEQHKQNARRYQSSLNARGI
jgi:UPF0755 protein